MNKKDYKIKYCVVPVGENCNVMGREDFAFRAFVVSKCFVIQQTDFTIEIVPYISSRNWKKIQTPIVDENDICLNSSYASTIYDSYELAEETAFTKNLALYSKALKASDFQTINRMGAILEEIADIEKKYNYLKSQHSKFDEELIRHYHNQKDCDKEFSL